MRARYPCVEVSAYEACSTKCVRQCCHIEVFFFFFCVSTNDWRDAALTGPTGYKIWTLWFFKLILMKNRVRRQKRQLEKASTTESRGNEKLDKFSSVLRAKNQDYKNRKYINANRNQIRSTSSQLCQWWGRTRVKVGLISLLNEIRVVFI